MNIDAKSLKTNSILKGSYTKDKYIRFIPVMQGFSISENQSV